MGEAQKIKQQKKQQEIGLHQQVFTVLRNLHERICQGFIGQSDEQNTHVMNLVYQVIDENAGISDEQKKGRFYFLDPIPAIDREGQSKIIKHGYWKDFNPAQIVDEVQQAISFEHTIDRDTVINWLQENTPADWNQESYDLIRKELSRAKSAEEKWSLLQDKFGIAIKKPRPINKQLLIHFLKNHHKLFELYEKTSAITASMHSMPLMAEKLIQARYQITLNPNISFEDQLQKHFIKQLPEGDQQEYQTTLTLINGDSYEKSAAVLSERHGVTTDPLPNLEREIEQARAYDYISTVISEDGVISREAIVLMLTKIGVLQKIGSESSASSSK